MIPTTMTVREYLGEENFVRLYDKSYSRMMAAIEKKVGTVEAERIADKVFDKAMNRVASDERIAQMPKSVNGWVGYLVRGAELEMGHFQQLKRSKMESLDADVADEDGEACCRRVELLAAPEESGRMAELPSEKNAVWLTVQGILKELGVGKATRHVFVRRAWFDDDYKVIARDLGITVNNCQQKYFCVKRRLKEVGPEIYRQKIYGLAA